MSVASGHVSRAKYYLEIKNDIKTFPPGKNFQNGFFVFSERKLLPHSPGRFVTSVSKIVYDPKATLSLQSQKFLHTAFGGSRHHINLYRSAGNRALVSAPNQHTGYYFTGGPGSGKSTLALILYQLTETNSKSVELPDLDNPFSRGELVSCNLILINEFSHVEKKHEKYLKQFTGRDVISWSKKNIQGVFTSTFNGIIVITSNIGPDVTFGRSEALNDRFIPVEFSPRLGKPDPNLPQILSSDLHGFLNWFSTAGEQMIYSLTRATLINKEMNFESNIMAQFIQKFMSFVPGVVLGVVDAKEHYELFLEERNVKVSHYKYDFSIEFTSACNNFYNKQIQKKRLLIEPGMKKFFFIGVGFRQNEDAMPKFKYESFELNQDIWENYRTDGNHEYLEVTPTKVEEIGSFLQNPLRSSPEGSMAHSQQIEPAIPLRISKGPDLSGTNSTVPEHTHLRTPASSKSKSKSTSKNKEKPVFATPPFEQFPIPQKPATPRVNKHTLTNFTEKHKYEGLVIEKPSMNLSEDSFLETLAIINDTIVVPLSQTQFDGKFYYHPHKLFPQTEIARKRIALICKLAEITHKYVFGLGSNPIIWYKALSLAQEKNPVPEGKLPSSINLYQKKNHFTGDLVPRKFFWDDLSSPRLLAVPAHTIRDVHRSFRGEIFELLATHSDTYLYDCDLSSCHARVITFFRDKIAAPYLYDSFEKADLYLEIAINLQKKHPSLNVIPTIKLRKIIKIKCLAMLNGGGLGTQKHISDLVEDIVRLHTTAGSFLLNTVCNILKKEPIVIEFHDHGEYMNKNNEIFILSHAAPLTHKTGPHKLNSPAMCCQETVIMTFLIEFIGISGLDILPITTIHDGILLSTKNFLTDKQIAAFNKDFSVFLDKKIGFTIPVEFELVGTPG